jgi:hypothetical protein
VPHRRRHHRRPQRAVRPQRGRDDRGQLRR